MFKIFKILLLIALIAAPIYFFFFSQENNQSNQAATAQKQKIKVALIFDDLGNNLQDIHQLYALKIPLTIAVIPGLRFSKNIAHIGARAGFSVLIHLPLEPKKAKHKNTGQYDYIGSHLPKNQINRLLNNYLNSIRIAIGVNNHKGSKATQNKELMSHILKRIKERNLIFIDSRTATNSVAYEVAQEMGLKTAYNYAFLDAEDSQEKMQEKINALFIKDSPKKIIMIAHPRENTLNFLKTNLSWLKEKIEFITVEQYFNKD